MQKMVPLFNFFTGVTDSHIFFSQWKQYSLNHNEPLLCSKLCMNLKLSEKNYYLCHNEITDKRTDVWSRPLCTYCGIFSPKKTGFSEIKIVPKKKKNFTFFLCNFSVRTLQCFQIFFFFFCPQKVEKTSLKSCS